MFVSCLAVFNAAAYLGNHSKILDPNKTMAVDAEDIRPIILHSTAPFVVPVMQHSTRGFAVPIGLIAGQARDRVSNPGLGSRSVVPFARRRVVAQRFGLRAVLE